MRQCFVMIMLCAVGLLTSCGGTVPTEITTPVLPPEAPKTGFFAYGGVKFIWRDAELVDLYGSCSVPLLPLGEAPVCGASAEIKNALNGILSAVNAARDGPGDNNERTKPPNDGFGMDHGQP